MRAFNQGDAAAWENYVQGHPCASLFHRLAWSTAVARAYGHQPQHLTAWDGDQLTGVLPLFLVRSVFVGKVLVSVPYATYGGVLADSPALAQGLVAQAQELGRQQGVNYIELRHREASGLDIPTIDRYVTFRRILPDKVEAVLGTLPRKARAAARNAAGKLQVATGPEWLPAIYSLYATTLRRLGSPNYSFRLLQELQNAYADKCLCLVVLDGTKPVAGVISYLFRDEICPYFSGSLPEGMRKSANNLMYLRLMEWAVEHGLRIFDFNRSRKDNEGPYDFKCFMGFEPTPLHYQIWLHQARELPNLSPSNAKFSAAKKVWQKMPLWFTRHAGAQVARWIP